MHQLLAQKRKHIALLITRLIIGVVFIGTGWLKVSDMPTTIGYFAQMGIPAFFAYIVGYLELIGGIMIVLGLWTCLAAAVLAIIMLFAIWFTRSMGFMGIALPLVTFAGLSSLVGVCGGKYALKDCCGCGCVDSCGCGEGGTCSSEAPKA